MANQPADINDDDLAANSRQSLLAAARHIFETRFHPTDQLESEYAKIKENPFGKQRRKTELEAKINIKRMFSQRLLNYQPVVADKFRCPQCWMRDEVVADLSVTSVGRHWYGRYSSLHCFRCHKNFFV